MFYQQVANDEVEAQSQLLKLRSSLRGSFLHLNSVKNSLPYARQNYPILTCLEHES